MSDPSESTPAQSILRAPGQSQLRGGQSVIKSAEKTPLKIDLIFCVDGTSSMQPFVEPLKDRLKKLVLEELPSMIAASAPHKSPDLRYRLIVFRDLEEDQLHQIEDGKFTADLQEIEAAIGAITTAGGGDEPESFLDAIVWALKSGDADENKRLRSDARPLLFVFSDAPAKPTLSEMTKTQFGLSSGSVKDVLAIINACAPTPTLCMVAPATGMSGAPNTAVGEVKQYANAKNVEWRGVPAGGGLAGVNIGDILSGALKTVTKNAQARTTVVTA